MFGWFKKKFNSKEEKLRLIDRVEELEQALRSRRIYKAAIALDKMASALDVEGQPLCKKQAQAINQCLDVIASHTSKTYESLLLHKCSQIEASLKSESEASSIMDASMKTDDALFLLLGRLEDNQGKVKDIEAQMDAALGTNKSLWKMLNATRTNLKNEAAVLSKNYETLLAQSNATSLARYTSEAKDIAAGIADQNANLDVGEFENQAAYVSMVQNEMDQTSKKMDQAFLEHFGGGESDASYERALEEKFIAGTEKTAFPESGDREGQ